MNKIRTKKPKTKERIEAEAVYERVFGSKKRQEKPKPVYRRSLNIDMNMVNALGLHVYENPRNGEVYITETPLEVMKGIDMTLNFRLNKEIAMKDLAKKKMEKLGPLEKRVACVLEQEGVLKKPSDYDDVPMITKEMSEKLLLYNKFRESKAYSNENEKNFYQQLSERIAEVLKNEMISHFHKRHNLFNLDEELRRNMVPKYFWTKVISDTTFHTDMSFSNLLSKKHVEKCLTLFPHEFRYLTGLDDELKLTSAWFYLQFIDKIDKNQKCFIFTIDSSKILTRRIPIISGLESEVMIFNLMLFKLPEEIVHKSGKLMLIRCLYAVETTDSELIKVPNEMVEELEDPRIEPDDYINEVKFRDRHKIDYGNLSRRYQILRYIVGLAVSKDKYLDKLKSELNPSVDPEMNHTVKPEYLQILNTNNVPVLAREVSKNVEERDSTGTTTGKVIGKVKVNEELTVEDSLKNLKSDAKRVFRVETTPSRVHNQLKEETEKAKQKLIQVSKDVGMTIYTESTSDRKHILFDPVNRSKDEPNMFKDTMVDKLGKELSKEDRLKSVSRKGTYALMWGLTTDYEPKAFKRKLLKDTKTVWTVRRTPDYKELMSGLANNPDLRHNVDVLLKKSNLQKQFDYLVTHCLNNLEEIISDTFKIDDIEDNLISFNTD
jgi:hypothetical protein